MASEPGTAENVAEKREDVQELKLGIAREWSKIIYVVSTFISVNIIPGLLFGTVVGLEMVVTDVPTLTRRHTKSTQALLERATEHPAKAGRSGGKR